MLDSWRWFGPDDPISLTDVRQTGAKGIVSALHYVPAGEVWEKDDIDRRRLQIEKAGLSWSVVESIPIHPSIKRGDADAARHTDAWIDSMSNLARCGLTTICYNFMPVVDWTRTDLRFKTKNHGLALRFDPIDLAAYDLFLLKRKDADQDYDAGVAAEAEKRFAQMDQAARETLEQTIIAGLPGSELSHSREDFRRALEEYEGISPEDLHGNLVEFVRRTSAAADELGIRLCLHPDDPPIELFGLPRVVSTGDDYQRLFDAVPTRSNGITLCAGSLASRPDNDVVALAYSFGERIHFVHLRNVTLAASGAFFEDDHLDGDVDMVALILALLDEERRRRSLGRDDAVIPMRPDHGHLLLDDIGKTTNPGYSAIGRLKGLAELRGVERALSTIS